MTALPWPIAAGLVLSSAACVPLAWVAWVAYRRGASSAAALRFPLTVLAVLVVASLVLRASYHLPALLS